jgi:competence protein ComEC
VVPFLRAAGVHRLDLVVASHPHADHVGGLRAVLDRFEVGVLWLCDGPNASRWSRRLRRWARARGVPVRRPRRWIRGAVTVEALWPLGPQTFAGHVRRATACWDPARGANDNSIVVRLQYGRSKLLLTGDIEAEAEDEIVRRWPASALRATVLKVPHHGSAGSSSEALLQVVRPRLAVISCGPDNRFAFPHRQVLGRLRRLGSEVARVDRLGAIVLGLHPDGDLHWEAGFSLLP